MRSLDDETLTTAPLKVRDSATVICIRQDPRGPPFEVRTLFREFNAHENDEGVDGRARVVFGSGQSRAFTSGWQVLMGQREVVNWMRSSRDTVATMRYPGEFVFAGGAVDDGETPQRAARREFLEEFGVQLPEADVPLTLLSVKQTRPINNKSNVMYNYVLIAGPDSVMHDYSAGAHNSALAQRRERFEELLESGAFWHMPLKEREDVAPEMRQVAWLDMADAVQMLYTSMDSGACCHVNEFQASEFAKHGITRRDPLFVTLLALLEIESFPSMHSMQRELELVDPVEARLEAMWLKDGMTPPEVASHFAKGARSERERRLTAEDFAARKAERLAADARLFDAKRRGKL